MPTLQDVLNTTKSKLNTITDESHQESYLLLEHVLNKTKTQLLAELTNPYPDSAQAELNSLLEKRLTGCPIQYVLGKAEFMGNEYDVCPGVLIPRPETELLVEHALTQLKTLKKHYKKLTILELGFGTGIISIEVALRHPELPIHSWDINPAALENARQNSKNHKTPNIQWHLGDFFEASQEWMPLINASDHVVLLTNPPYIPTQDIQTLESKVKDFEPTSALDGGEQGLDYYKGLTTLLNTHDNFTMILEIGINQEFPLISLMSINHYSTATKKDLSGIPRVLLLSKK